MIGLAFRLGVPPSVILNMPDADFVDCLAFLSLEQKDYEQRTRS